MALPALFPGNQGDAVMRWQLFLVGKQLLATADGIFGQKTEDATKQFQTSHGLNPDSIVGPQTYAKALAEGFNGIIYDPDFPPKPGFPPITDVTQRQSLFGMFRYVSDPVPGNREHIRISGNWVQQNIINVDIPQLQPLVSSSKMEFHHKAAEQLKGLWAAWEAKNLISLILTFDGSFVPRFMRGVDITTASDKQLSNHAFGSAFDINAKFNGLGHLPALLGQRGSVRPLVPIANDYGFYWGGHFNSRKDGMHFEVAKILSSSELSALATKYGI